MAKHLGRRWRKKLGPGDVTPCFMWTPPRTGTRFYTVVVTNHPQVKFACHLRVAWEGKANFVPDATKALIRGHVAWEHVFGVEGSSKWPNQGRQRKVAARIHKLMLAEPFVATLRCPLRATITHSFAAKRYDQLRVAISTLAVARQAHREDVVLLPINDNPMREPRFRDALRLWGLDATDKYMDMVRREWQRPIGSVSGTQRVADRAAMYDQRDLAALRDVGFGKTIDFLREYEDEIRPVLEDAGYTDLPWYT